MDNAMNDIQKLVELINDPIDGPHEGEDFSIDDEGNIQVSDNNVRLAANIMRKANTSGEFAVKLVKLGHKGDSILLGFDTLVEATAIFSAKIGYRGSVLAEVKKDETGKCCVYFNNKRLTRMFSKITTAKKFIKDQDKELLALNEPTDEHTNY
jgi:hypothetical protein